MLRMLNFLLVGLMLVGAGVVYDFKYQAEKAASSVSKVNRKIDAERDAIAMLKAEWSLLNQPKRLQDLVQRHRTYLELDPLDPTQIATLDDIPFKPAVPAGDRSVPGAAGAPPMAVKPQQALNKGSVKLAQPDKGPETTGSIGKLLDRLPSSPSTTGSVPKASPNAPLQLGPVTVLPKPSPLSNSSNQQKVPR